MTMRPEKTGPCNNVVDRDVFLAFTGEVNDA